MHQIDQARPFSQSRIWQLQRDYFSEAGINAWRSGEVPHYISSNPAVGKAYAELVLAFLRDLSLKGKNKETVYLVELGAGHGRLCYHFFKHFEKYYAQSAIPLPLFCYILSDFTEANLDFWRDHPRLQPYLGKGWLDFALFDAENSQTLDLQYSGNSIKVQSLAQPILVMANYFFDTIPQELYRMEKDQIALPMLSLSSETDPATLDTAGLINALALDYTYEQISAPIYPEAPVLQAVLDSYCGKFEATHLLFPHIGIGCLERLRQLSTQGMVLLTADKGKHHLSSLDNCPAPRLSTHGSFSLTVNYHAFGEYCKQQGGLPLFPRHQEASLDLGCLLFLAEAPSYLETRQAYERFVNDFGPDDYFSLKKLIEQHFDTLNIRDIMGTLRLSGYDARIFRQMMPRLYEIIPSISNNERWNLFQAIHRIWDTYYPLGEPADMAHDLGDLLFELAFYKEAVLYYEISVKIYGKKPDTLYNLAWCHCLLGEFGRAAPIIGELQEVDSENEGLRGILERFEGELKGLLFG